MLLATPFAIGALVVYGARQRSPTIAQMLFLPWGATLAAIIGSALAALEGSICIALATPLVLLASSVGGLVTGLILRVTKSKSVLSVVALPLMVLALESPRALPDSFQTSRRSIEVAASPETIWQQIRTARDIRRDELPFSLTHLIGVPRPVEGVNVVRDGQEIRFSKWDRGVNFRGIVTESRPFATIGWRYQFDENSFPPGSMDDHVVIGGRHFDLIDTQFNLVPIATGRTRLEIVSHYRVSTHINFYTVPLARLFARDFTRTILHLYKSRSERAEIGKSSVTRAN
ncbi:MAG: SRPBCC domain-containing protein [Proteobacteria bacterium]|nr:SRPBCC domain-containing protein [Pseudomonadota bacterium]